VSDGSCRGRERAWLARGDLGLGQIQDKDTGLDYLNARYYDPTLAHFISADPLNDTSAPQTANPYTYGADNPTTFTDPTGLRITGCDCQGGSHDPAPRLVQSRVCAGQQGDCVFGVAGEAA
jgi:RHS repeat-associated protein